MKHPIHSFFVAMMCGISLLMSSCATIAGFHTGRTVGEDVGQISTTFNVTRTADYDSDTSGETDVGASFLELGGRYGVSEKVDVGVRMNTFLNFLIDGKIQLVGDQQSPFALAVGAGFGGIGLFSSGVGLFNFQLPVYASFHPKEKLHLYVSPRYIMQFSTTIDDTSTVIDYGGFNIGALFGYKNQFGIDIGVYGLSARDADFSASLVNIGFGMLFHFSGKYSQN